MEKKKPSTKRLVITVVAIVVVLVALASVALAYYLNKTEKLNTTYNPAESKDPSFLLDSKNKSVEDVKIKVGETDYPVFVRVVVLINWENHTTPANDEDGTVYYGTPVPGEDYTILFDETKWTLVKNTASENADNIYGYFYYKDPVASDSTTEAIIKYCTLKDGANAPNENYVLSVKIVVQTIQAIGVTDDDNTPAWEDAEWDNAW